MEIVGGSVQMQIDTGPSCNLLPKKFGPPGTIITRSDRTLKTYSKFTMPVLGTCRVSMLNPKNSKKYNAEFGVQGNYTPLIGFCACHQMNLVTVHQENIQQENIQQVISHQGHKFISCLNIRCYPL